MAGQRVVVEDEVRQHVLLDGHEHRAVHRGHRQDRTFATLLQLEAAARAALDADAAAQAEVHVDVGLAQLGVVRVIGGDQRPRCLLYTSDAADERSSGDVGGRRVIKKKKQ